MSEISNVTVNGTVVWKQDNNCSGFKISNKDCKYRIEELEIVSYIPSECTNEWKDD